MTISSLPPFFHIIIHSRKPKKTEMMVSHPLPLLLSPHLHSTLLAFFVLYLIVLPSFSSSESEDEANYKICKERYDCGLLQNLTYPFWGGNNRPQVCGHLGFELNCEESRHPVLMRDGPELIVLNISQASKQMTLARLDFLEFGLCPLRDAVNTSLNEALFRSNPQENTLLNLVYNCSSVPDIHKQSVLSCPSRRDGFFYEGIINEVSTLESVKNLECDTVVVQVPVPRRDLDSDGLQGVGEVETLVRLGFNVSYEYEPDFSVCDQCVHSGGVCGTNLTSLGFACFCRNKSFPSNCPPPEEKVNIKRKVIIAATSIIGTVAVMFTIFCFWLRRNKNKYASSYFVSRSIVSNPPPKTDVEKGENSYHGVHLFTYAELEEATNHFDESRELGDGGFGTVYYGKLRDGRVVAVKRLYENNYKRVEQFKNEIEILAGLRHDHLVSLHGCTSRHSRELLLVYDYISNGTVADHLHGERAKPGSLPWGIRMKIAIETATALAYLHASDIIHRDVKTNNILLDDNFCVKVADFGLSRLFPTNVTHVSTAPQGTPGYVDPEYHECYQLTSKSDVYSFGVVLVELISSLPAVDITRHRHEINLSNMAVTKIQSDALHELVDSSLGFETDYMVTRMISGVAELAFQCLQCAKDMRPTMDKVLEVLKEIQNHSTAKAEEIDIPSDDVGLLKSGSPSLSPDSVTAKWNISSSTTPNASG